MLFSTISEALDTLINHLAIPSILHVSSWSTLMLMKLVLGLYCIFMYTESLHISVRVETVQEETTLPRNTMFSCVMGAWKLVYLQRRCFIVAMDHPSLNWVLKPLETQHPNNKVVSEAAGFYFYWNIRLKKKKGPKSSFSLYGRPSNRAVWGCFSSKPLQIKEHYEDIQYNSTEKHLNKIHHCVRDVLRDCGQPASASKKLCVDYFSQ